MCAIPGRTERHRGLVAWLVCSLAGLMPSQLFCRSCERRRPDQGPKGGLGQVPLQGVKTRAGAWSASLDEGVVGVKECLLATRDVRLSAAGPGRSLWGELGGGGAALQAAGSGMRRCLLAWALAGLDTRHSGN
jgi:hypothetical protein